MGYRKIKLDCASVCSDAWSRGQSCHCANLPIMLIMLILRDKNSVLILCIIVVAVFFVQGSSSLLCCWDTSPLLLPLFLSPPLVQSPVTSPHTHRSIYRRWCAKAGRLSSEADQPWEAPTATSTRARRRRVAHDMRLRALMPLLPFRHQH